MLLPRPQTVETIDQLRDRVFSLFSENNGQGDNHAQMVLDFPSNYRQDRSTFSPRRSIKSFLDFLTDAMPDGDVYMFGGILRDMALYGRRGFNSDIDLVVDGDWENCRKYIVSIGAKINKFGGYRFCIDGWPVDIWSAKDTWAVTNGLVAYESIASLTKTTVLNWDAILMNWRTRAFVHDSRYLDQLKKRVLDITLLHNPDPLGMAVRVFRHLILKDAEKITPSAAQYLVDTTKVYTYEDIRHREAKSYSKPVINPVLYHLFSEIVKYDKLDIRDGYAIVSAIASIQHELNLSSI